VCARLVTVVLFVLATVLTVGCSHLQQQAPPKLPPLAYAPDVNGSQRSIDGLVKYLHSIGYTHLTCTKLKHELDCEAVKKGGKHVFLGFPFDSYNCSGLERAGSQSTLVCAYRAP
jgi:hypothetical protein